MNNPQSQTHYIIYHQAKPGMDCPDGICSAWVAHKAYPSAQVEFKV